MKSDSGFIEFKQKTCAIPGEWKAVITDIAVSPDTGSLVIRVHFLANHTSWDEWISVTSDRISALMDNEWNVPDYVRGSLLEHAIATFKKHGKYNEATATMLSDSIRQGEKRLREQRRALALSVASATDILVVVCDMIAAYLIGSWLR